MENQIEVPFVFGNIVTKDAYVDEEESHRILNALQSVMIEFGIIRIDLSINPYTFPTEIAKI